jgi:hypothetical protein
MLEHIVPPNSSTPANVQQHRFANAITLKDQYIAWIFPVAKIGLNVTLTMRRPRQSFFGLRAFLTKQKPPCFTVVCFGCRDRI